MDYTYISVVLPNLDKIEQDVVTSNMTNKALVEINYDDITQDLVLTFTGTLDVADQNELQTIVNNNQNYISKKFKINGKYISPKNKNINLYGLYRKDTIDSNGSLVVKEYYKSYDGVTYSDLAVKDEYIYNINTSDLVTYRDETITWYYEDDTVGEVKSIKKYYDLNSAVKEGITRRNNLIDKTKAYGLSIITGTHASGIPNAHYYFNLLYTNIIQYTSGIDKTLLINQINNTDILVETYMTQTIKDTMVGILDYWT